MDRTDALQSLGRRMIALAELAVSVHLSDELGETGAELVLRQRGLDRWNRSPRLVRPRMLRLSAGDVKQPSHG
jgi:hypothetical protein